MRSFYYKLNKNFGDHMNAWMWPQLFPEQMSGRQDDVLVGIGTLIKESLNELPGRKIVFGAGTGYGDALSRQRLENWLFYFVRGPLTAAALGLPEEKGIVDAAWLVDQLPDVCYKPDTVRSGTVFVPHWTSDVYANWKQPCDLAGIRYVSPLDPDPVLPAIAHAELAIVESLHGAIMADYYRVPWIPVATNNRILEFKWRDFSASLDLNFQPHFLPVTDIVERLFTRTWGEGGHSAPAGDTLQAGTGIQFRAPKPQPRRASWRATARTIRDKGLNAVAGLRQSSIYRSINAARSEQLAELLRDIATKPVQLSTDANRQRKLDQLAVMSDQFRKDFPEG
ncbi:polysaccharide pyruvyl transferase family protein [Sphingomonas sp. FW199]|uniref:polysaccharide pyruvyl transferase family protein n=1 Tax=Sphingomonas sp. FW199 TaxID=3400217 RepID=UPI003CEEC54A